MIGNRDWSKVIIDAFEPDFITFETMNVSGNLYVCMLLQISNMTGWNVAWANGVLVDFESVIPDQMKPWIDKTSTGS